MPPCRDNAEPTGQMRQLTGECDSLLFYAGPMNVILYGAEGKIDDPSLTRKAVDGRARRNFGVICESQRPIIK